jgi:hypothetical protein
MVTDVGGKAITWYLPGALFIAHKVNSLTLESQNNINQYKA